MDNSPDLLPSLYAPNPEDRSTQQPPLPEAAANYYPETNERNRTVALEQGVPASPPPVAASQLPPPATHPAAAAIGAAAHPLIADDSDLIEKEWVEKAKEIVAKTSQDPYQQNKQMTLMKADYLKKRYNKDIKLSDDK